MNRNMKQWLSDMIASDRKTALPILSFPSVSLLGITVRELISDSDRQAQGMKLVAERVNSAAAGSLWICRWRPNASALPSASPTRRCPLLSAVS